MSLLGLLGGTLGVAAAKFLFKNYLGLPDEIAGGLGDIAAKKIDAWDAQREAKRQFEKIDDDALD